jgi:hypothetical protein
MKYQNISELCDYLGCIQYDEVVYFQDDNFNQFWLCVEENWISLDDSIPEDELTEEDMESYSCAKVQSENYSYHLAEATGNTIQEAAARALYEFSMIDDETIRNSLFYSIVSCKLSQVHWE